MSKKSKKQAEQGTWALCITAGLIIGLGLGAILGYVLVATIVGGGTGATVAYLINQRSRNSKR